MRPSAAAAGSGNRHPDGDGVCDDSPTDPVAAALAAHLRHPGYFLFITGSSTHAAQNPLGFMLDAFFTILIFIVVSYAGVLAAECANETSADSKLRL